MTYSTSMRIVGVILLLMVLVLMFAQAISRSEERIRSEALEQAKDISKVGTLTFVAACHDKVAVEAVLTEVYDEKRYATGNKQDGDRMDFYIAEDGGWTMIFIQEDEGRACVAAGGGDFQFVEDEDD